MSENVFDTGMGIKLRRGTDGNVESWMGYDIWKTVSVVPAVLEALQGFFQWERDQQVGRVRWPEYPAVTVYPSVDPDWVAVFNEATGLGTGVRRESVTDYDGHSEHHEAARWWFDTHPTTCGAVHTLYGETVGIDYECSRTPHTTRTSHWHKGDGFDLYWRNEADK